MAGNNYTLSLSAQVSTAGLQAQLDAWAKEYVLKLNAAIQNTQASGGGGAGGGSSGGGVAPTINTNTDAVEQFNAAAENMNATSVTTNNLANQTIRLTEAQSVGLDEVTKRTISLNGNLTKFKDVTTTASVATKGWVGDIANAIEKMAMWAIAATALYGSLRAIQDGVQYIKDLNEAMTNTQMVTGFTDIKIQELTQDYHNMAMALGVTTLDIQQSSLEWLRQGKSASDAAELTKDAIMMSKLAMTDAGEAAANLTAIMNGFQLQASDVNSVMDKMLALTNSTKTSAALTFGDISNAMQSSAAIANELGISFDQLSSYIATVATVTQQSGDTVGQSLKMMMSRMSQVKAGATEGADSFNNVQTVLQKYNMSLLDTTGAFKPLGEVIDEIAQKWQTLDGFQQRQIITAVNKTAATYSNIWTEYNLIQLEDDYIG